MFLSSLLRIKFVSVAEDKEQCAAPVPIGFSPATELFALLGGASKQHSLLTGLDFWVDFLWRKSWRLFMAELERQSVFAVSIVLSIWGGIWSLCGYALCAREARKRERNLRTKDQKLQARNGTKLVHTWCRG
jgi:hypothetical protein